MTTPDGARPDYAELYSQRSRLQKSSAIRELLALTARPEITSFGGGLPSPDSFPGRKEILELVGEAFDRWGPSVMQYCPTEGFPPLIAALEEILLQRGLQLPGSVQDTVRITVGSQQGISVLGSLLLNPGQLMAAEEITYLGKLQAFAMLQPNYIHVQAGENGVDPHSLEEAFQAGARLVYLIPNYHNPKGVSIPLKARYAIAQLAIKYGAIIIEDDPYVDLDYDNRERSRLVQPRVPIQASAPYNTAYLGTFSKVLAPGYRVGYVVAPPEVAQKITLIMQGTNLQAGTMDQAMAAQFILSGRIGPHIEKINGLYKPRRDAMYAALSAAFSPGLGFSLARPTGGMFAWLTGPEGFDSLALEKPMIKEAGVAVVSGSHFYAGDQNADNIGRRSMRINFTNADVPTIYTGVERMARFILNR